MGTSFGDHRETALPAFDRAKTSFALSLEGAPEESLAYLKPGDDYSLGGLVHHVNAVLEHYLGALELMVSSGYREGDAPDRPGLFEEANALAKAGVTRSQLDRALATTDQHHAAVRSRVATLSGPDFERKALIRFQAGAEPSPSSAADIVGWLTGHYEEHVAQTEQLLSEWRAALSTTAGTMSVIEAFNTAFAQQDVEGVMHLMTEDCVFENTFPAPDGQRHVGAAAVGAYWRELFTSTGGARFETEEAFAAGDRAICRWVFHWEGPSPGHVRGVDVFKVRAGKVAEKLSYVKG